MAGLADAARHLVRRHDCLADDPPRQFRRRAAPVVPAEAVGHRLVQRSSLATQVPAPSGVLLSFSYRVLLFERWIQSLVMKKRRERRKGSVSRGEVNC